MAEVVSEREAAVGQAVKLGGDRLTRFSEVMSGYAQTDPLGEAVRNTAREIASWLSSPKRPVQADSVIATALAIEVISSVFAWGGDEGDVPNFTYLQVSPLARNLVAVTPVTLEPGQQDYEKENREWAAKKLYGERWGHFGAFAIRRGREHDWLWGRLDGASALVHLILGPDAKDNPLTTTLVDAILAAEYSGDEANPLSEDLRTAVSDGAEKVADLDKQGLYRMMMEQKNGEERRELLLATIPEVLGETALGGRGEVFGHVITKGFEAYLDKREAAQEIRQMWLGLLNRAWRRLPWGRSKDDDR